MLKLAITLLFAVSVFGQQSRVRILTYNIHHGEGTDTKIDAARIAAVIQAVDPDFVAVQEVDVRTTRVAGADLAHQLATRTGLHAVFGKTMDYRGGWYGNALLSRWPLQGFVNHEFPHAPTREPRAVIDGLTGEGFHFLATHLDITEPDRLLAAARLAAIVDEHPAGMPMILAGDLNATPGSATMNELLKAWTSAALDSPLLTSPATKPVRQIDFILFRPAGRWRVVEARVLDEAVASDHRPLFAILELVQTK